MQTIPKVQNFSQLLACWHGSEGVGGETWGGAWSRGPIAEPVCMLAGFKKHWDSRMNGGQLGKQTWWSPTGRGSAKQKASSGGSVAGAGEPQGVSLDEE